MSQVYLDLVDGFHLKVTPLRWVWRHDSCLPSWKEVLFRVDETKNGFKKGEETQTRERELFCIAGYSRVSRKIKAVAPDLSHLEEL